MFDKKYNINHVVNYTVFDGNLLAVKSNGNKRLILYDLNNSVEVKLWVDGKGINRLLQCGDRMLGIKINGSCIAYDKELNICSNQIDESIRIGHDDNCGDTVIAYSGRIKDRASGLYSVFEDKFIWQRNDIKALQRSGDSIFSQNEFKLFKHDPVTGEVTWSVDFKVLFPDLSEKHGRILILDTYKEKVYAGIDEIDKFICLNTETGKIEWEINSIISGKQVDKTNGVIHSFLTNYTQLCLNTGKELKSFVNRDYFASIGIETQRSNFVLLGNHIITTDWKKGKIGGFNFETFEFDWVYEVPKISFPAGRNMKFVDPYLFVFDAKDTLLVFEKTERK